MDSDDIRIPGPITSRPTSPARSGSPISWGLIGLALASAAFMGLSLARYLPFDPSRSLVELPPRVHPLLVGHVFFGAIAMATALLQITPSLRRSRPALHRLAGRLYVFAGVLPAGALAIVVACFSPFGPVARASNLVFASTWLAVTVLGWRAGRHARASAHRRWMIRSAVLTFSILTNRIWGPLAFLALQSQRASSFHGDETFFAWTIAGLSTWLGWVLPLLVTEFVLESRLERDGADATGPPHAAQPW